VKYLAPFKVLRNSLQLLSVKGQIKVDMSYDDFLTLVKQFLLAVPIDETWYRATYPDVDQAIRAGAYRSARHHFVENGYYEGRRPFDLEIDEGFYMRRYPDIQNSVERGVFASALDHFRRDGYDEGRLPAEL
jgi:hypothetical protein